MSAVRTAPELQTRSPLEVDSDTRRCRADRLSAAGLRVKLSKMQSSEVSHAVIAATLTASALDLTVDDASVLHNSNKLALRLVPCDVFARVAHVGQEVAQLEVELALRLAETEGPVAALEPRVEPRYER